MKKVVVTGLGTVNPMGNSVKDTWVAAKRGESGIGPITLFDPAELKVKIAGEVKNFDPSGRVDAKDLKRMSRFIQLALYAAYEAMQDADLKIDDELSPMAGVIIGTGIGGLPEIEETVLMAKEKGYSRVSPFFIPMAISNMAAGLFSIAYNTRGYNACVVSACSTGNHSIGDAARMIERGEAKVMIAGGTEAAICKLGVGGFAAMRALSTRNDDPKTASRPYDQNRDGFVMAEGCGILVLEEEEFAKKRGAHIHARLVGYGASADAHHITAPNEQGPKLAMGFALCDAGINKEQVDYICAHGTSTPIGDLNELNAIQNLFGEGVAQKISISATKSMSGHLLGGAGGLAAVIAIKALQEGFVPPTINIFDLDLHCKLDITPNQGKERKLHYAMTNSFGFGGTNASLLFQKF